MFRPGSMTRLLLLLFCLCSLPMVAQARSPLDGSLTVVNDRFIPVSIAVDQEPLGIVAPKSVRRFADIPNGVRVVRVTSKGRRAHVEHVSVGVSSVSTLKVAPQRGSASIKNDSSVKMRVALDGRTLGTVGPGRTLSTGLLLPGRYRVTAVPVARRWAKVAGQVDLPIFIQAGVENSAEVAPFLASVRVTNPIDRRVAIILDGKRVGTIKPRGQLVVDQQIPGAHRAELRTKGHTVASAALHLVSGEVRTWRPRVAQIGQLKLRNNTGRRIGVAIDGRRQGILEPGEIRVFEDLPVGPTVVTSRGAGGWSNERVVRVRPHRTLVVQLDRPRPHVRMTSALYAR